MNTFRKDEEIARASQSNFLFSFLFLPREKRQAIYTLYAFCRQTDDIADMPAPLEKKVELLNQWEQELVSCFARKVSNYFYTVRNIAEKFRIPLEYFLELIEGVRMDLQNISYNTFDELKLYCYRVASTVGLMSVQIFGYRDPIIKKYAESLGIALQLTNIIRDVDNDARMGRIYIPREDLERFNISPEDILSRRYNSHFQKLMEFEARRAYHYYRLSEQYLPPRERRNMIVGEIIKSIYLTLLKKIEEQQYNIFDKPVRLSTPTKLYVSFKTASQIFICPGK